MDELELKVQRKLTAEFIAKDSTDVVLTPRTKQVQPGGGHEWVDGTPRPQQTFKMISQGAFDGIALGTAAGVDTGPNAQARRYEYVMLGLYDAIVEIKDWFEAPDGQRYEVVGKMPYNGYETKFGVISFGSNPREG